MSHAPIRTTYSVRATFDNDVAETRHGLSSDAATVMMTRAPGLPLATLSARRQPGRRYSVVTSVDAGGRLADRSPLQLLGWKPRLPIRMTVPNDVVVIVPCPGQTEHVSSQGRIRLTSSTRHILGVTEGDRLYVVAAVDDDQLTIYPMWLLDSIVMEFDRHVGGRRRS
ncbi:AbrB/MazE/SpoVT family DNA-binding domain-containing protein [Dactylosporangium sucinum]|uniref:Uncharacterized protein n=1 Tax=Dactylosporangium sucinum TaxID=1424081 RepID=A0A917U9W8_9ACTN|nr:AbrB/MazE/SpoVT family DNA-binding domain-containing protein [Dactylosporangium sucinum]GGM64879.1 hypothetical protein GCM10007977_077920 [Dactylosporangium sucinum]